MRSRSTPPFGPSGGGGWLGGGAPAAPDVWVLLSVVFVTFSLQSFQATWPLTELMRLSARAWSDLHLWRLVTYPFAGVGGPSLWILLELFILYLFGKEILARLGRARFWRLLLWTAAGAAVVALLVDLAGRLATGAPFGFAPFTILQGQRFLIAILVAAFATLHAHATIYLFFVLPVQARWFIPLEIVFAFLAFLGTKDLAGFLGLCAGIGLTGMLLAGGGLRRGWRDSWLRMRERWMRWRLDRLRRRRRFRVVKGDRDQWLH